MMVSAALFSIVAIACVATRSAQSIDGIAFSDAKEVKSTVTEADLKLQDSLVVDFTS